MNFLIIRVTCLKEERMKFLLAHDKFGQKQISKFKKTCEEN